MATSVLEKTKNQAQRQGEEAAQAARPWVEVLARLGYGARGVVYIVLGILALQASNGAGSPNVDKQRVLYTIVQQPMGRVLLGAVALGLAGYALWRLVLAVTDPEGEGTDRQGLFKRAGYVLTAISYASLSLFAWRVMMRAAAGGDKTRDLTAQVMGRPFGRWVIGLAGLALVGAGLYMFYQAYKAKFEQGFKSGELTPQQREWTIQLGRVGYATRGVIYVLIGTFLVQAALAYDPNQAGGLGEALQTLSSQPYGTWVLAAAALGLLSYGLYSLALALFRRIRLG